MVHGPQVVRTTRRMNRNESRNSIERWHENRHGSLVRQTVRDHRYATVGTWMVKKYEEDSERPSVWGSNFARIEEAGACAWSGFIRIIACERTHTRTGLKPGRWSYALEQAKASWCMTSGTSFQIRFSGPSRGRTTIEVSYEGSQLERDVFSSGRFGDFEKMTGNARSRSASDVWAVLCMSPSTSSKDEASTRHVLAVLDTRIEAVAYAWAAFVEEAGGFIAGLTPQELHFSEVAALSPKSFGHAFELNKFAWGVDDRTGRLAINCASYYPRDSVYIFVERTQYSENAGRTRSLRELRML